MIGFEKIRSWTDVSVSSAWRSMTKFLQIHVMLLLSSFVLAHIRVYKAVGATHLYLHPHTNSSFCLTEIHVWAAYVYFSRCCLSDGHGYRPDRQNVYKGGQRDDTILVSVHLPLLFEIPTRRHSRSSLKRPSPSLILTQHTWLEDSHLQMPSFHPRLLPHTAQRTTTHATRQTTYNHT